MGAYLRSGAGIWRSDGGGGILLGVTVVVVLAALAMV